MEIARISTGKGNTFTIFCCHIQGIVPVSSAETVNIMNTYIIKDVRLFLNSVDRGLHLMRQAGVDAGWNRQDTDREILLTIRIPKRASGKIDSVSESC